jgi:transposase
VVLHTKEFKEEAVRLLELREKPASELARELGINRTLLYRWRDKPRKKVERAFPGGGRPRKDQLSEIARLRRELKEVTEERDIFKKAVACFAKRLD